jgi:hypothetical protein
MTPIIRFPAVVAHKTHRVVRRDVFWVEFHEV